MEIVYIRHTEFQPALSTMSHLLSNFSLYNHPESYHVLLMDALDNRVRLMKGHDDLSESRAHGAVKGEEKRRENLYHKLGKTDYGNPFSYHMALNMIKISPEQAPGQGCYLVDAGKY